MRDKLIEKGYFFPLIFAIILLLLIGMFNKHNAQSPAEVYRLCLRAEIKHPEIVVKQSILETGWYECEECSLDHNNIFGFRWKKQYLEFPHWARSIYYYKWWQDRHYKGGDYYEFLTEIGYATGEYYIDKLKSIEI